MMCHFLMTCWDNSDQNLWTDLVEHWMSYGIVTRHGLKHYLFKYYCSLLIMFVMFVRDHLSIVTTGI